MFKSDKMEPAVDLLVANFHTVLVIGCFYCYPRIRLRADLLKDKRIWFSRTKYQIEHWHKEGGVILTYNKMLEEGDHDAIFFIECPRSQHLLDVACQKTRHAGAVFIPPTWRIHEESLARHMAGKSERWQQGGRDDLARMIQLAESFPTLTQRNLDRLRLARESSQSSSAPESREAAGLPSHRPRAVP